ncbi:MAG: NTP transferase domain-containing protein [Actinobacteria bacterium]|nr:NTP transferase domain-containing protein [Actinomycetota bacterium]
MLPPFTGAVLTGGSSRRMGHDKATAPVGGRALAAVVAAALRGAGADPVVAIGGDARALARLGLAVVADDHPSLGPLGGLLTALRHAPTDVVAVLACDLPGAEVRSVRQVVAALAGAPAADWAAPVVDGHLQPLHAAWRRRAQARLQAAFDAGERSVRAAMESLVGVVVESLDATTLADVDEPAALLAARLVDRTPDAPDLLPMSDAQPEIDVQRLAELRDEGAWVLDVRQPDEYEAGHVPGAHLIPLGELSERHTEVPVDREVYVVCGGGGRSAAATEALNGAGYRAVNVAGGTRGWVDAGNPVVTGPGPT